MHEGGSIMEEKCMTCGGKLGMLGGKAVPGGRICPKCVSRLGTEIMREIQTFTAEDIKDFIAVDTSGSPLLLKYRANVRLIETEDKRIKSWDTEIASVERQYQKEIKEATQYRNQSIKSLKKDLEEIKAKQGGYLEAIQIENHNSLVEDIEGGYQEDVETSEKNRRELIESARVNQKIDEKNKEKAQNSLQECFDEIKRTAITERIKMDEKIKSEREKEERIQQEREEKARLKREKQKEKQRKKEAHKKEIRLQEKTQTVVQKTEMKNYYGILEVSENASSEVIEISYQTLIKKYQDGTETSNKKVLELNEAYYVLSNIERRKQYDKLRKGQIAKSPQTNSEKMEGEKWYYSGLVLLATYCLCMPVSWVLTFLRYKNIERQSESYKKRTKIAVGIQVGLLAVSIIISIIISIMFGVVAFKEIKNEDNKSIEGSLEASYEQESQEHVNENNSDSVERPYRTSLEESETTSGVVKRPYRSGLEGNESETQPSESTVATSDGPIIDDDVDLSFLWSSDHRTSWYSQTTGLYLITDFYFPDSPYGDTPNVVFTSADETITAVTAYYTECIRISRTPNGGIEYLAKLESADRENPEDLGTIKIIWNSWEQLDYPIVEVADPSVGLKDMSVISDDYVFEKMTSYEEEFSVSF